MVTSSALSRQRRRTAILGALIALLLFLALPATGQVVVEIDDYPYGFQGEGSERIADVDNRAGEVVPSAAQVAAAKALGSTVRWNAFGTPHVLVNHGGTMSAPRDGEHADIARRFVREHRELFKLSSVAVADLEVLRESPMYDSPDLARVRDGQLPANPDVATVVLFRQTFGALVAGLDGLLTVGVTADGAVAWVSSSVTGDTRVSGDRKIDVRDAYRIAAGDVGRAVDKSAIAVATQLDTSGFTTLNVDGLDEQQYARLRAVPTPTDGVRLAWEIVVLDSQPTMGQPLAFIHFIDAETGAVLFRSNRVDHFAGPGGSTVAQIPPAPPAPPSGGRFGPSSTTVGGCGPDEGPFPVAEGNGSIQVTAVGILNTSVPPDDDIKIDLIFGAGGPVVADQDLLTSPEVLIYSPEGGVPAGDYFVRICPFNSSPTAAPITYIGALSAQEPGGGGGALAGPRWQVFPANPDFADPVTTGEAVGDTRETWCWFPGEDCDRIVGMDGRVGSQFTNDASRFPWDINPFTGQPSFTTDGNNASTAISEVSFATPDTAARRPFAADRNYDFAWDNTWFEESCDPTTFNDPSRNRNDEDAATANLFVMHNRMHDWGYYLGWTEVNSTLQQDNFGNTGPDRETDPEVGQSQSGRASPAFTGRDNANQITLQDGVPGITNQYLWQPLQAGFYAPCVDGAYDMSVVGHEVGHAIQFRMTAGPDSGLAGLQARSMGESWSDLTAIEYLNGFGFVPVADEDPFSVGAYVTGDKTFGIRNYNMSRSPLNFSNIEYDGNGTASPHADGEIWSAVNFDIRERFNRDHDAAFPSSDQRLQTRCADGEIPADLCPGNRRWVQLMHDGFLLQPSATSMLDSRDAILAADVLRFGGENQDALWDVFAVRGMGSGAQSNGTADRQPTPDFASPLRADNATVRFRPVATDGGPAPNEMNVYVGVYEARATPLAVSSAGATTSPRELVPATYQFIVQAPGFGAHRFVRTFGSGEDVTLDLPLRRNLASAANGSTASGDGGNFAQLIDETEATNYASFRDGDVRGKQVTVALGEGRQTFREVAVSAALRPAVDEDPIEVLLGEDEPPYDTGGQNRFSALRQFAISTCDATTGADCRDEADFGAPIFISDEDAYPATRPRPTGPDLTLRPFAVPETTATHVRLEILNNQCTGGPDFTGGANPDDDPLNDPDCVDGQAVIALDPRGGGPVGSTSLSQAEVVRVAELQVFGGPADPIPGGGVGSPAPDRDNPGVPVPGSGATVPAPGTGEAPDPSPAPAPAPAPAPSPSPVGPGAGGDVPSPSVERIRGPGRIDTAIALSQAAFDSAPAAVLARADLFPDALAAAPLAAEVDGPVLLTPSNALDADVATELRRLGVSTVYLAGGPAAVSEQVATDVRARGITVRRVSGPNRFGTAVSIAEEIIDLGGDVDRLLLARADEFPDALAASNLAIAARGPILLTTGDQLEATTGAALDSLLAPGRRVTVVGGPAALSERVVSDVRAEGFDARRTSGRNRFETAVALVTEARALGAPSSTVMLASGAVFADALAAGPAAAKLGGVLLLIDPGDLERSVATREYLQRNATAIDRLIIAGGPAAVSESVAAAAARAAGR